MDGTFTCEPCGITIEMCGLTAAQSELMMEVFTRNHAHDPAFMAAYYENERELARQYREGTNG